MIKPLWGLWDGEKRHWTSMDRFYQHPGLARIEADAVNENLRRDAIRPAQLGFNGEPIFEELILPVDRSQVIQVYQLFDRLAQSINNAAAALGATVQYSETATALNDADALCEEMEQLFAAFLTKEERGEMAE